MSDWSEKIIVIGVGDVDTEKIKETIVNQIKEAK